jgi:hypothetical protein
MVRNLPEVNPGASLLGFSGTDTSLQVASISGLPGVGGELGHLISGVGGIRQSKKAFSGCAKRKLKKAKAGSSEARTGGMQRLRNANPPKQGETSTGTHKRLR